MAVINHSKREINAKLVYFGPPGVGKESIFRFIHQRIKPSLCGALKSMPSGSDNLLFFDYIPFETSSIDGYRVKIHLYTLTGAVANPGTWKMVLKGVDGVALVGPSDNSQGTETIASLRALRGMLSSYGRELREMPRLLLQRQDCQLPESDSELALDFGADRIVAIDTDCGAGLLSALARLSQEILQQLKLVYGSENRPKPEEQPMEDCLGAVQVIESVDECVVAQADSGGDCVVALGQEKVVRLPITISNGSFNKRCVLNISIMIDEFNC